MGYIYIIDCIFVWQTVSLYDRLYLCLTLSLSHPHLLNCCLCYPLSSVSLQCSVACTVGYSSRPHNPTVHPTAPTISPWTVGRRPADNCSTYALVLQYTIIYTVCLAGRQNKRQTDKKSCRQTYKQACWQTNIKRHTTDKQTDVYADHQTKKICQPYPPNWQTNPTLE